MLGQIEYASVVQLQCRRFDEQSRCASLRCFFLAALCDHLSRCGLAAMNAMNAGWLVGAFRASYLLGVTAARWVG